MINQNVFLLEDRNQVTIRSWNYVKILSMDRKALYRLEIEDEDFSIKLKKFVNRLL